MNKKLIAISVGMIILLVVIIIIFVVVAKNPAMVGPNPPVVDIDPNNPENKSPAEQIVVNTYKITNPSQNRDVRTEIPRIMNLDDSRFQEYMNQKMLQTVTDYQNEIEIMIDEDTPATTLYKYVVSYDKYTNDKYLSFVVSNDYQTGGMRSNTWKDTYNIDVTKGANKEIFLKDLFTTETDYKKEILKEVNAQAVSKNYELVGGSGLASLPDTQKFYLKDGKLVIYFDPAAIAPYVYGELHFEMPFVYREGKFYME